MGTNIVNIKNVFFRFFVYFQFCRYYLSLSSLVQYQGLVFPENHFSRYSNRFSTNQFVIFVCEGHLPRETNVNCSVSKIFIIILLTLTTCFLLNCSSRREEPSNVYDRFSSAVLRCISLNPITKSWTYILTNVTFEALLNKGLPNDGVHIFERFSGLNSKSLVQLLYSMATVANFPIIIIHLTCFLC